MLAVALCAVFLPATAQEVPGQDGRYLVQFRDFRGAVAAVRAAGGTPVVELAPQSAVAAYLPAAALSGLRRNPNVVLIEPDPRRYPYAQTVPYGIPMVQADQVSDASASNTTVCVIDSGYYRDHRDLPTANVTGSSDSGSGPWYADTCGHGTHVAGTIAALRNNAEGVVGVVGDGNLNIRAEKVFDGATCSWSYSSNLISALNACRHNAATSRLVVNMSLGGSFASSVESSAFQQAYEAGVLSVAAAGNAGNRTKSYPASYPSVISVAAIDSNKTVASFSQQNDQVELAAPGVGVLSTVPFLSSSVAAGSTLALGENIDGSARTNATAALVDGGTCNSANGTNAWNNRVVLCERGGETFATKVGNVKNGGGVAAVIYNNVAGGFTGTLNGTSTIPAISIARDDGLALKAAALGLSATVTNVGGTGSGYAYYNGTSMATPHVAGVAALVWSNQPLKSNVDLRAALQATAEDLGARGRDNAYGYGLVQARRALDHLIGGTPPPANQPPTASFTFACTGLTCNFTDTSSDPDGAVASWSWNFGDGTGSTDRHPTKSYAEGGSRTVTLTVTDNNAATATASQQVAVSGSAADITLTATGAKVKGVNTVTLLWSGATSERVDVFRNDVRVVTTENDGEHKDSAGKGGATYVYKVCEAATDKCSAPVQIAF